MTLIERLRVLSCADHISQHELDTIMDAIRYIERVERIAHAPMAALDDLDRLEDRMRARMDPRE